MAIEPSGSPVHDRGSRVQPGWSGASAPLPRSLLARSAFVLITLHQKSKFPWPVHEVRLLDSLAADAQLASAASTVPHRLAMPGRRRHLRRRKSWNTATSPISIRVGSRSSSRQFYEVSASGARDASRFARLVADQVRSFPCDPLVIAINGYQPWLEDILNSCIEDYWSAISELDRQVQFAGTMQFPERASKRGQDVPWTFVLDHMNVPQVYYWSVDMDPPGWDGSGLPDIEHYRFRVGAWECGRAACRFDREVPVAILFTKPTPVAEYVVTELLFGYLHRDGDYDQPREDEEGICWLFSRLYWLLTDWQNIISEIVTRLNEAEANSHDRHLPVKTRTRLMHNEVDRLYELKEYLHFHNRAFRKLQKLKADVPQREQRDPLWTDMDDAVEDLEQYNTTLDGLKERKPILRRQMLPGDADPV